MFSSSDDWENGMLGEEEASVEDDIKGTSEIFLAKRTAKSEEEISKYCVAEGLDEISRTIAILKEGMPIQKANILSKFEARAIGKFRGEFRDKILPICLEILSSESAQFQMEFANILPQIIPQLDSSKALAIFQAAKILINHKNEEISKPWREVFIAVISQMTEEDVKREVLPEAMADGGSNQPAPIKIWTGRRLGAVAGKLDPKRVETQLYPKLSILCQDTDSEVRKSMCAEMGLVIKSLGLKLSKKTVFPDFLDLVNDEDLGVQEAGLIALMSVIDTLDSETRRNVLIPTWKEICSTNDENMKITTSQFIGSFMWISKDEIPDEDRDLFSSYYRSLSCSTDVAVRRNCVFNFPAIVASFNPLNFVTLKLDTLLDIFQKDEDLIVRKTFASFFAELCKLLGAQAFKHLGDALKNFLECTDEQVYKELYRNLSSILTLFHSGESPKLQSYLEGLFTVIVEKRKVFDEKPNIGWRTHEIILRFLENCPALFDHDTVNDHLVPIFQRILIEVSPLLMKPYPAPVKKQSVRNLVTFMRKLKKHEHHEIILRILLDIKDEKSYQVRRLFFDICEEVLMQFSQRFFRSYFFIPFLGLSRDSVSNVRLGFIEVLPLVRHTIRIPADQLMLTKLLDACESLAVRDTDRGVLTSMNEFMKKYGSLASTDCCQYLENTENTLSVDISAMENKKCSSQESLTDMYFKFKSSWHSLSSNEIDKQKEEAEQKTQYFLLDPSKRHAQLKVQGPKKAANLNPNPVIKKAGGPIAKKDIAPTARKEATPISTVTTKVANVKVSTTPMTTGDAAGKAKESTIPRVTKPVTKKDAPDVGNSLSSSSNSSKLAPTKPSVKSVAATAKKLKQ